MVNKKGNKILIAVSAAVTVVILGLLVAYLSGAFSSKESDPYRQNSSQQSTDDSPKNDSSNADSDVPSSDDNSSDSTDSNNVDSDLDPATVSTLPIEAAGIEVAYVKGIGGFEYHILRTESGTSYVEFSNPDLKGTKCTDDNGAFVSIIIDPKDTEDTSTISQKVTVDGTLYGLSLLGTNCTGDTTLFAKYQDSFKSAFSLLKKIDSN